MHRVIALACLLAFTSTLIAQNRPRVAPRLPQVRTETALCQILDAMGDPIVGAEVVVRLSGTGRNPETFNLASDMNGAISFQHDTLAATRIGRVKHPEYGEAEATIETTAQRVLRLQVPLAKRGSEARGRALKGIVKGSDGRPIPRARVECTEARTPGEGLIAVHERAAALTDREGRFTYYVPDRKRGAERGVLIPPGTTFYLEVESPHDPSLFPHLGMHSNSAEAVITLQRPEREFALRYEGPGGDFLEDFEAADQVRLQYQSPGSDRQQSLPKRYILRGLLPHGTYYASMYSPRDRTSREYLPVTIDAKSPADIAFKLPGPVTYHGKILEAVTGKPMKNCFVTSINAIGQNNLALLSDADWKTLHNLGNGVTTEQAKKVLSGRYSVSDIVRTGDDGSYVFIQPAGVKTLSLLAFERGYLPYRISTRHAKPDKDNIVELEDIRLFQSATVLVAPLFTGQESLAVAPEWSVEEAGQPDWFNLFAAANIDPGNGVNCFEYVHWLKLNVRQPLLVPAGISMKLIFNTPYDTRWGASQIDRVFQLRPGETLNLGKLTFNEAFPVRVKVVDDKDQPVEGVPVSRLYQRHGQRIWSVVHNSNAEGVSNFFVAPKTPAQFGVTVRRTAGQKAEYVVVDMKPADATPAEPVILKLTAEQVERIRGRAAPVP